MLALPVTTKEYLRTTVTASADPTAAAPQFAFVTHDDNPVEADWKTGQWDGTYANGKATARILVGPGTAVVLTVGDWRCWLRITDNPEIPVMQFDTLLVR